ncbi:M24 family metallopeptidase [Acidobacteriota bacterium]
MKKIIVMAGFLILCVSFLHPQVTCFTGDDFIHQRERLLTEVNDGVILLDAAVFPAEFFYLTGVQSKVAKLILIPDRVAKQTPRPAAWQTTLYLPVKTPRHGVWDDTPLCYRDNTESQTGISANAPLNVFYGDLAKLGNITDTIYIPFRPSEGSSGHPAVDLLFAERVKKMHPDVKIKNLLPVLDRMRWKKTDKEIEIMRHACKITVNAFEESARYTAPGQYEYEIEAIISYLFRRYGSQGAAFIIVGSGPNSCILHHSTNDRQMKQDELLVLDIGTRYCSTVTDLTRTIPVSGRFTAEQRKIYEIVLKAQKAAISVVKPGVTLDQVHQAAFDVIADAGYGKYFIHGTSHTMNGGNTADPRTSGLYYSERYADRYKANDVPLVAGSIFTIEPGIYIAEKSLGIRIEDDILVTPDGYEVLTAAAPKEIKEIEELMKQTPAYLKK